MSTLHPQTLRLTTAIWMVVFVASTTLAQPPVRIGKIIPLDDGLSKYLADDAAIEVLGGGFQWTEGPCWIGDPERTIPGTGDQPYLIFSDVPQNTIFRWTPGDDASSLGSMSVFMKPSGFTGVSTYGGEPGSNGLMLDGNGHLNICEHGDRRISRLTPGGGKITVADRFDGKRFNSPNDLVFDSAGNLFFTDPPYGLPKGERDPAREMDICGVYRMAVDGNVTLVTDELPRPNGVGLSPDEKTLYVAQSDPERPVWMAYPLKADGTVAAGRELASAKTYMADSPGLPDGFDVHSDGTLFASGPGGVFVITPGGKLLGRIHTGGRVSNCTLDDDETTLYMTCDDDVCRVALKR